MPTPDKEREAAFAFALELVTETTKGVRKY